MSAIEVPMSLAEVAEFFGGQIIHSYTRAQAIADGALVDITTTAREAGFRWPVAITAAAHARTIAWDEGNGAMQDTDGRAWDVVWMGAHAARTLNSPATRAVEFGVFVVPNTPGGSAAAALVPLTLHGGGVEAGQPGRTHPRRGGHDPRRWARGLRAAPRTGPPQRAEEGPATPQGHRPLPEPMR